MKRRKLQYKHSDEGKPGNEIMIAECESTKSQKV